MLRVLTPITSLAGSDTTASATRAILLHVVTNPQVLERLLEEISKTDISSPIKDSEAKKMPFLQAVIKEGLRIHPPVTGLMLKEVPPGGDNVLGHYLPAQTKLGYCAFGLFLDPKLWGQDSMVYRPERWLEGTPEEIGRKENDMDLVFGWGRSQCLGKTVAAIELNKIIVEVSTSLIVPGAPELTLSIHSFSDTSTSPSSTPKSHGTPSVRVFSSSATCGCVSPRETQRASLLGRVYL